MDGKNGNAGPKLHLGLWEKSGFPALTCESYFLADNKGHNGDIWTKRKLFLTYCFLIGPIFKELEQKCRFAPIDSYIT